MFARPGITSLRDQATADMLVALGLPTLLPRSPLRAMAYAQAGLAHGQYGYLDWIARQSVPFTATGIYLEAWGALVGVRRKPAAPAAGTAALLGVVGSPVPVGTVLRRADGASYVTTAALVLTGNGAGSVAVRAVLAGSAPTLTEGVALQLAAPLPGVQMGATGHPVVPGTDPELDAPFRTRVLLRWAEAPQGGSAADYRRWALAVPGVTRAWVIPRGMGPGTVLVYTMFDIAEAAHGGFPQGAAGVAVGEDRDVPASGDLLTVADALLDVQPVTALVYSVAPAPLPVPFVVTTPTALTASQQAAGVAALQAVFLDAADATGTVLPINPFDVALGVALGTALFTVLQPAAPVAPAPGRLPVLGAVTWQVG